jgi:hypothetical protein
VLAGEHPSYFGLPDGILGLLDKRPDLFQEVNAVSQLGFPLRELLRLFRVVPERGVGKPGL